MGMHNTALDRTDDGHNTPMMPDPVRAVDSNGPV